jgi:hypothetical protein
MHNYETNHGKSGNSRKVGVTPTIQMVSKFFRFSAIYHSNNFRLDPHLNLDLIGHLFIQSNLHNQIHLFQLFASILESEPRFRTLVDVLHRLPSSRKQVCSRRLRPIHQWLLTKIERLCVEASHSPRLMFVFSFRCILLCI